MKRRTVSATQLDALEATAQGRLSRSDEPFPHWRIDRGIACTATARALLDRELIEEGVPLGDGRIPAVLTAAGRELLDDLASREPEPEESEGQHDAR